MAEAVEQLRNGVPLNWTQIEDDEELAVLDSLQDLASECVESSYSYASLPPGLRSAVVERLALQLPPPKPKPVKQPPKPLAGFSEAVPVLTQAEEEVPSLISNVPQWVGLSLAGAAVVVAVLSVVGVLLSRPVLRPAFAWIDVWQNGKELTRTAGRPVNAYVASCQDFIFTDLTAKRSFVTMDDRTQLQLLTDFKITFPPDQITSPATYKLQLLNMGIAPCERLVPDASDLGTTIQLSYSASIMAGPTAVKFSPLSIFEVQRMPASFDVGKGTWKEIKVGDAHGIYWRGASYTDLSGESWTGNVSVMLLERGDMLTFLVGDASGGVTEDMLTQLARRMR